MPARPSLRRALEAKTPVARQRGVSLTDVVTLERPGLADLTWGQRLDILDAWSQVLDGVYAHLPLKRALYGFDPIRALAHLREQVPTLSETDFHRELTVLINRLRDAHTQYYGPRSLVDAVATLPFLVESFGPPNECRFVVSKVSDSRLVDDPHFVPGVTLQWWNGMPFGRAVDVHADRETGGRPDARRARALDSLTFRALEYGPPPDEHWVQIGYTDLRQKPREIRFDWRVVVPNRAPSASGRGRARRRRGIDPAAEAVRRAKKLLFNVELWSKERAKARASTARTRLVEEFADFLSARIVTTASGKFGYLRIWSFDVDDDDRFIEAALALLDRLPTRGLIIDIRDNPGGFIWAAERMLQLFTPHDVVPTKFALRATPLTASLAAAPFNREELGPWADSLASAPANGEPYSVHLPITPVDKCNDIRQRYGGPIVVVVDANTYSSGDLFAAGVVDNRIGPVVCIGEATGAGGANVWGSDDIVAALEAAGISVPRLAQDASFTVSVRRAVRSGAADGVLIEDAGIPGQPYVMTFKDIFEQNVDLIEHCGRVLAAQPITRLEVTRTRGSLRVTTAGLDHLDVYVDEHPAGPGIAIAGDGSIRLSVPDAEVVEIRGFAQNVLRQRRQLPRSRARHR